MKITAIYATGRKGVSTTYSLAQTAIKELKGEDEVKEFFLPKDMNHFCLACYSCFENHPERCGGYEQVSKIVKAMDESELIIFTAPVYVFHVPGQVKALLDHFAYKWMVHRPNGKMFTKQALIITTAAGGGMKSTLNDMKHSMDFWGVGRLYTYYAGTWSPSKPQLTEERMDKMKNKIIKITKKISKRAGKVRPRIKVKLLFYFGIWLHKKVGLETIDSKYWKKQGWLDGKRPW